MADPVADNADFAVDELKRKARRRLVGAIVIALAAATILPLVLEKEQKPLGDDVSVQIPAVDNGKFVSRLKDDKSKDAPAGGKADGGRPRPPTRCVDVRTRTGRIDRQFGHCCACRRSGSDRCGRRLAARARCQSCRGRGDQQRVGCQGGNQGDGQGRVEGGRQGDTRHRRRIEGARRETGAQSRAPATAATPSAPPPSPSPPAEVAMAAPAPAAASEAPVMPAPPTTPPAAETPKAEGYVVQLGCIHRQLRRQRARQQAQEGRIPGVHGAGRDQARDAMAGARRRVPDASGSGRGAQSAQGRWSRRGRHGREVTPSRPASRRPVPTALRFSA